MLKSEDVNEEETVVWREVNSTQQAGADTSRTLQGVSLYSDTSMTTSFSLMSERVVRAPLHCGSALTRSYS